LRSVHDRTAPAQAGRELAGGLLLESEPTIPEGRQDGISHLLSGPGGVDGVHLAVVEVDEFGVQ
jgi:hypothetical protein